MCRHESQHCLLFHCLRLAFWTSFPGHVTCLRKVLVEDSCLEVFGLQVWEVKDLGLQATQRINAASDPLAALTRTAQNFPNLANALSRVAVSPGLRSEAAANAKIVPSGMLKCYQRYLFPGQIQHLAPDVQYYDG